MIHKMLSAIGLGSDEKIYRVIYKNPIIRCGSMYWSTLLIRDDDDIEVVFDNLNTIQVYNHVEILS